MGNMTYVPDSSKVAPIIDIWQPTVKPEILQNQISSWVPVEHRRRLASYILLHAVYNNSHGEYMMRNPVLEFGDASLVADTLRDALIGSTGIKITSPDIESNAIIKKRVDRLKKWWKAELMDTKVFENETNCTVLGDSVYRLRWRNKGSKKSTVKVDTFDPGFFFPVFDEDDDLIRVHLAWEEKVLLADGSEEVRIYKETYELIDDVCYVTAGWYELERVDTKSDLEYSLNDLELIEYKLDGDGNPYDRVNLQIDFIPVVYVPNINVQGEPFGRSDLAMAIDLLCEIANTNTDMAANTSLLGSPPLVVKADGAFGESDENGISNSISSVGPGQVIEVGTNGDAHLLDVAEMNAALDSYLKKLDQKLYENTRATKLAAGKMEGSVIPSGISLRLMQNPLVQKTLPKRLLRSYKFALLLKFVQKMFILFGEGEDKTIFDVEETEINIEFGDIFPTDRTSAINDLAVAYTAGFLSLDTAVRMCMKYGVDIDDVKAEVERIKQEREELNTYVNVGSGGSASAKETGTQSDNIQKDDEGTMKSDNKQVSE